MTAWKDWVIPIHCSGVHRRKNPVWVTTHCIILLPPGQIWHLLSLQDCTHIFIKSMFHRRYFLSYNYIIIFVGECRWWYWYSTSFDSFFSKVPKALTLSRNNWNTFYTLAPFPCIIPCMSCNWQCHSLSFKRHLTFLCILTPSFGNESIVDQCFLCSLLKACCSFSFLSASWTNTVTWHCC